MKIRVVQLYNKPGSDPIVFEVSDVYKYTGTDRYLFIFQGTVGGNNYCKCYVICDLNPETDNLEIRFEFGDIIIPIQAKIGETTYPVIQIYGRLPLFSTEEVDFEIV